MVVCGDSIVRTTDRVLIKGDDVVVCGDSIVRTTDRALLEGTTWWFVGTR